MSSLLPTGGFDQSVYDRQALVLDALPDGQIPDVPGLAELWSTGEALAAIAFATSTKEKRSIELDLYPTFRYPFNETMRDRMYQNRAHKYAVIDKEKRVHAWNRHLLTQNEDCEEVPMSDPRVQATGLPAHFGYEAPKEAKAKG